MARGRCTPCCRHRLDGQRTDELALVGHAVRTNPTQTIKMEQHGIEFERKTDDAWRLDFKYISSARSCWQEEHAGNPPLPIDPCPLSIHPPASRTSWELTGVHGSSFGRTGAAAVARARRVEPLHDVVVERGVPGTPERPVEVPAAPSRSAAHQKKKKKTNSV